MNRQNIYLGNRFCSRLQVDKIRKKTYCVEFEVLPAVVMKILPSGIYNIV
jgi:hypothetical protein